MENQRALALEKLYVTRIKQLLLPAIFSTAALMAYCAIGAYVIREIEYEHGVNRTTKDEIVVNFAAKLCELNVEGCANQTSLESRIFEYRDVVLKQVVNSGVTQPDAMWTFIRSSFYCWTLITTVGYGHYAPTSVAGRIFTMLYCVLGIPLLILNATKLGTLFTSSLCQLKHSVMKWRFQLAIKCKKNKMRKKGKDETKAALVGLEKSKFELEPEAQLRLLSNKLAQLVKSGKEIHVHRPDSVMPTWIAWFVVPAYLIIMAFVFYLIESWTFFDSFYFTFVTFTSIGFGDIVPTKEGEVLVFSVFVFLGIGLFASLTEFAELRLVRWSNRAKDYLLKEFGASSEESETCNYCDAGND